ncbi:glycoside hydrolase family 16 protein [Methylobacterium sp. A49B]
MKSRFRRAILMMFPAAVLSVVSVLAACNQLQAGDGSLQICRYKKVWGDDFNDLSVSKSNNERARWSAHTPWNGDFGDAKFLDPIDFYSDPERNVPFFVKNGILTIRARKHENGKWTSGLLSSADPTTAGFAQTYGYFEARMKLPPGPGVWPAFWLASNSRKDDKTPSVEIDVIEYYGHIPDAFNSVLHVWNKINPEENRGEAITTKVPSGSLSETFHTYGVEVTKEWIIFYLDRREIGRKPTPHEHTKPLMMLVNLALGSGWPIDKTRNPSDLLVDYVHAYAPDLPKRDLICKE